MRSLKRRDFVKKGLLASAGLGLIPVKNNLAEKSLENNWHRDNNGNSLNLLEEILNYRKVDAHAHVYFTEDSPEIQIDYADRVGIETLIISRPRSERNKNDSPSEIKKANDLVLNCVKTYPDRFIGQITVNPIFQKEALYEIGRCIDQGMVGLKLYNQLKINDPLLYPIIEKMIGLNMVILMHVGIGNARVKLNSIEPKGVSTPSDFVDISNRYPEGMFQLAHIGGGIDWEDACKAVKDCPNVFVDLSGSNNVANMVEFSLKYIGEDRMLFGCDNSFYQGVGHVFAAKLSDVQRRKIFFENYNNILRRSGNHLN